MSGIVPEQARLDFAAEPVLKQVIELSLIKLSAHNREREIPPEALQ